jgi:5-methylcytosine-specific restriction endonuclease McrA
MKSIPHAIQLPLPIEGGLKTCSKCKQAKPDIEFCKSAIHRDGLYPSCKTCRAIQGRKYYAANRAKVIERTKRNARKHPERGRRAMRAYEARNPGRNKRWLDTRPGKRAEYDHRYRAQKMSNGGRFTAQEWQELKAHYEYRCLCCGKQEPLIVLCADHVIPIIRGGRNDISNIQPLCKSCNSTKATKSTDYRP